MDEKEEFQKRYNTLSFKLKEALFDKENAEKLNKIGRESNLSENSISDLAKIAGKVFLGIIALPKLAKELEEKLNTSEKTSQEMAQDLNSEIFYKYKKQLEELNPAQDLNREIPEIEKVALSFKPQSPPDQNKTVQALEEQNNKTDEEKEKNIGEPAREEKPENFPKVALEKKEIKKEKPKKIKEIFQNKKTDTYQEPIEEEGENENENESEPSQILKEKGKIKGIF